MAIPGRGQSRIVLIGTAAHQRADVRLPDVSVVANNLADLAAVFTDPDLGGFDTAHCVTVPDGADMPEVGRRLVTAAAEAEDLLLIYYSGHGLLDIRGKLHLALAGTDPDFLTFTSLPYETLREVCLDSPAKSKIVILDSCYSGRAIGTLANTETAVLEQLDVAGTYILASCPPNRTALYLPGERNTAFTGRLLELLRTGDPAAGETLGMGDIYRRLRARLKAESLPEPQRHGTANADLLGLVRNRQSAGRAAAVLPAVEEVRHGATTDPSVLLDRAADCAVAVFANGEFIGSGFFVAPEKVVTCAHVVLNDADWTVGLGDASWPATVSRKLPQLPDATRSSPYPYPDLAILVVTGAPEDQPVAWLDDRAPRPGTRVWAHGFVFGQFDVGADLYTLRLETAGFRGKFLRVVDDVIPSGMGGSAVVDAVTGRVCGFVNASQGDSPGGLAVPAFAIRDHLPDVWAENQALFSTPTP